MNFINSDYINAEKSLIKDLEKFWNEEGDRKYIRSSFLPQDLTLYELDKENLEYRKNKKNNNFGRRIDRAFTTDLDKQFFWIPEVSLGSTPEMENLFNLWNTMQDIKKNVPQLGSVHLSKN